MSSFYIYSLRKQITETEINPFSQLKHIGTLLTSETNDAIIQFSSYRGEYRIIPEICGVLLCVNLNLKPSYSNSFQA